jgi:acyl carrier protein
VWADFVNHRSTEPALTGALARDVKNHVKERRPDYMVPSAIVILDALPRTPNGKVDWKALPTPSRARQEAAPSAPPRTETERIIAGVWKNLLNLDRVGLNDNFFDLGANSLTMVQASSQLRDQLQRPLSLISLFQFPTVSALAGHIAKTEAPEPEIEITPTRGRGRLDAMLRRVHARQVASEEIGA